MVAGKVQSFTIRFPQGPQLASVQIQFGCGCGFVGARETASRLGRLQQWGPGVRFRCRDGFHQRDSELCHVGLLWGSLFRFVGGGGSGQGGCGCLRAGQPGRWRWQRIRLPSRNRWVLGANRHPGSACAGGGGELRQRDCRCRQPDAGGNRQHLQSERKGRGLYHRTRGGSNAGFQRVRWRGWATASEPSSRWMAIARSSPPPDGDPRTTGFPASMRSPAPPPRDCGHRPRRSRSRVQRRLQTRAARSRSADTTMAVRVSNTAVAIFTESGTNQWTHSVSINSSAVTGASSSFGVSLALHGDQLFIGDSGATYLGTSGGVVFSFRRNGSTWVPGPVITPVAARSRFRPRHRGARRLAGGDG